MDVNTGTQSQDIVPDQVWEQDVADGGAVDSDLPPAASAVVVQGVSWTREAPCLAATFGLLTVPQSGTPGRIGRNTRRRSLLLSVRPNATATAYIVVAENAQQAAGGYGLPILQGAAPVRVNYAGDLYFTAFGADLQVGFIAELDQG